jgi:glycine cleavage system H protein
VNTPSELLYTKSDEWVRDNGDGTWTIGITDYAQDALGEIVYAELPGPGESVAPGAQFGVVESVKAVGDLHAPVGGEVVASNQAVIKKSDIINASPYEDGWLIQVRPADAPDLSTLLDAAAYAEYRS